MKLDNGYETKTTFWMDFSIADRFGAAAVRDTFNRSFNEWRSNYEYLTELVLVLNHKIWQWYKTNEDLAKIYNDLWEAAQDFAYKNLQGEELAYFFNITD